MITLYVLLYHLEVSVETDDMKLLLLLSVAGLLLTSVVDCRRKKKNKQKGDEDLEIPEEARLYKYLTDRYDRWNPDRVIIPVQNVTTTMNVSFGLSLISLLDYDESTDIASLHTWEQYTWMDRYLKWDPDEFGGIDVIRLPVDKIWSPDMVLHNDLNPSNEQEESLAIISYEGHVWYVLKEFCKVICSTNSTNLSCRLLFASWMFDGFRLNLKFNNDYEVFFLDNYIPNKDYELVSAPGERHVVYYACCVEPYPDLTFTLNFKKTREWWEG